MFNRVLSASLVGLEAVPVYVETDVSDGLPMFTMEIGRASCRERV